MKQKFTFIISIMLSLLTNTSYSQCTTNYLSNPSFESPIQTNIGNNLTGLNTIGNWTMTGGPFNVIRTDGSAYSGGPDNAQNGQQYIDVTSAAGTVYQDFTITCTTDITFGGYFSRREVGGSDFTAFIEIVNTATNVVVATSTILTFTNATNQETWFNASGTYASLPPGNYRYRATIADFANFDNALLCLSTPCILPIKFSQFKASYSNCKSLLNWSVVNDNSIKSFDIEHSINGVNFTKIGSIPYNTNEMHYSFDHNINASKSFYRIKGIEVNGTVSYTKILILTTTCEKNTSLVYPNPVKDILQVSITSTNFFGGQCSIYNTGGKLLKHTKLQNGSNEINIHDLPTGIYNLRLINNNTVSNHTILKVK